MTIKNRNAIADDGKRFVLTLEGYGRTPPKIRHERRIGSPVKGFENKVPITWVIKGYVKEE